MRPRSDCNQKSIHNHLQGADGGVRRQRKGAGEPGRERAGSCRAAELLGLNQICYKTVKVCDSDRKQDSKSLPICMRSDRGSGLGSGATLCKRRKRALNYSLLCIQTHSDLQLSNSNSNSNSESESDFDSHCQAKVREPGTCIAGRRSGCPIDSRTDRQRDTIQSFHFCCCCCNVGRGTTTRSLDL